MRGVSIAHLAHEPNLRFDFKNVRNTLEVFLHRLVQRASLTDVRFALSLFRAAFSEVSKRCYIDGIEEP